MSYHKPQYRALAGGGHHGGHHGGHGGHHGGGGRGGFYAGPLYDPGYYGGGERIFCSAQPPPGNTVGVYRDANGQYCWPSALGGMTEGGGTLYLNGLAGVLTPTAPKLLLLAGLAWWFFKRKKR
jgi:hypothetical protein